jgi:hypothetical protein
MTLTGEPKAHASAARQSRLATLIGKGKVANRLRAQI